MRTSPLSYQQTDDDLKYLADLNNDYSNIPTLPDGGAAMPAVDEVVQPAPENAAAAEPTPEDVAPEEPAADVAPAAEPAPEAAPAAAPPVDKDWYHPLVSSELANTKGTESKLVSKAPEWFNFDAPPEITGNEAAITSLVAGLIQAGLAPDKKTAIAMALGGVADAAGAKFAAPQQDYQNRLKAAKTQADMSATLRSGAGNPLGAANLDLQWQKFLYQLEKDKGKEEAARLLKDPNSAESKSVRDALVAGGAFKPDVAAKLSGAQLLQGRVAAQQQAGAARSLDNQKTMGNVRYDQWIEKFKLANNEHDRRQALEEIQKISAEDRDKEKLNEQADIPGWKIAGKRAPNLAAVEQARTIADATERATAAAEGLGELQQKLSAGRLAGKLYTYFANDPEGQQALMDAKVYQKQLMDSQRELSKLGVLQQFEKEMVETTNPEAGSLDEFFLGPFAYNSYARLLPRQAKVRMKAYGYAPDDGEEAPPELPKAQHRDAVQGLRDASKATAGAVDNAIGAGKQAVENAAGTVGKVAGAVPGAKTFKIQVLDPVTKMWGAARDVTEDQYRQAMKKLADKQLGPSYIRKAQ